MAEIAERYAWATPGSLLYGEANYGEEGLKAEEYTARLPLQMECHLLLVCKSNLERECLYNGLIMNGLKLPIVSQAVVGKEISASSASVILIHIGSKRLADPFFAEEIQETIRARHSVPVVLLGECEEWAQVARAVEIGARGYIPTSVDIKICVEAMHLALAGGMYLPASTLMRPIAHGMSDDVLGELLTVREVEVVHAIRLGKANKIIAFELGMSEGTVKAHVHNIMRKIGAANRTEVVCKLHKMYGQKFPDS